MIMGNLLYIIAIILITIWLVGYFIFDEVGYINMFPGIAIVLILVRVMKGKYTL
jgi:hypothetical protein